MKLLSVSVFFKHEFYKSGVASVTITVIELQPQMQIKAHMHVNLKLKMFVNCSQIFFDAFKLLFGGIMDENGMNIFSSTNCPI